MRAGTVAAIFAAISAMLLAPAAFRAQTPAGASSAPPPSPGANARVNIDPRIKGKDELPDRPDVRVDTNLVLIPVSVTDSLGRPVAGLEAGNFKIFDNKAAQTITSFSMDDGPVAIGLVFDTSGTMTNVAGAARRAARLFVGMANQGDEFLLVEFDDKPRLTVPLTNDVAHIQYELTFNEIGGNTALIDGVYLALHEIKKSDAERKALIVVSDGDENNSRYSEGELRTMMQESEVLIYSVAIPNNATQTYLLRGISNETGGRMFIADSALPEIATKISIDLRNRYVLGYVPTDTNRDGLYHKVEVELKPPRGLSKLKTHWRRGYYAPTE